MGPRSPFRKRSHHPAIDMLWIRWKKGSFDLWAAFFGPLPNHICYLQRMRLVIILKIIKGISDPHHCNLLRNIILKTYKQLMISARNVR